MYSGESGDLYHQWAGSDRICPKQDGELTWLTGPKHCSRCCMFLSLATQPSPWLVAESGTSVPRTLYSPPHLSIPSG